MSKKRAIIFITAAFLVGAIVGGRITGSKYKKSMWLSSENEDSGNVKNRVYLLNLLRTNNAAKAIENLEMNLDWDLIGLGYCMSNAPKSPLDPYILKTIREAKEYRGQFPHKSDGLDEEISNVFLRVNILTNK